MTQSLRSMLADLLEKLFPRLRQNSSRETVKNRLKLVLTHDRIDLTPRMVEQMQQEILKVITRYVEIDTESLEFSLSNTQRSTALVANFPIRRVRPLTEEEQLASGSIAKTPFEELEAVLKAEKELEGMTIASLEIVEDSPSSDLGNQPSNNG
ncbi:MAG: cell division topological specificity factor MinE [Leptolyngbyaceae cyanobacterium bins.59]|nr:cell division topological specificity factor MinE [Leptolyngbyaceae cyanobacterium bins.59]